MNSLYNQKNRVSDTIISMLIHFSTLFSLTLLIMSIGYIFLKGIPHFKFSYLITTPSVIRKTVGILPNIINTIYMIVVTLFIAGPISIGGAIYLNEYATNKKFVRLISFTTEILAGIPSIIYGLFGMLFFGELLKLHYSILTGALTLAIMVLPIMTRNTQIALQAVPKSYREAALGMGSTKWYMIRTVLLPSAIPGILTGIILAMGRIIAESAALMFTAGSFNVLPRNIFSHLLTSGATLTVALYFEMANAHYEIAFMIALILVVIVLILNFTAKWISKNLILIRWIKNMSKKIKAENLNLYYGEKHALKNVTLGIEEYAITAFIGPSGCGKSTFLKTLNRMNDYVKNVKITGSVTLDDEDIFDNRVDTISLRKKVGMVFQQPNPFPMSIYDNVAYGPRIHGIKNKRQLDEIVERSLKAAALYDEVADRLHTSALGLSGGQQQRLCIARCLAVEPEVILLDEPTSALDPISTLKIEELLLELKNKYTIAIVTHNMQQASRIADYTAFFLVGEMVEYGKTNDVFSMPKDKRTEDYITGRFG